jgi:hypothetical protein
MTRLDLAGAALGFVAFEYGVAQWSHPAAWVIGGLVFMGAALWPSTRKAAR